MNSPTTSNLKWIKNSVRIPDEQIPKGWILGYWNSGEWNQCRWNGYRKQWENMIEDCAPPDYYAVVEPPPKLDPFEEWWNSLPSAAPTYPDNYRLIDGLPRERHFVHLIWDAAIRSKES